MTFDLFDLTLKTADELDILFEGLATAGAVGTLTDTNDLQTVFSDDHFNRGTVWIVRDAAGAGAAPEGEFTRVSDFVSSTGVVTFRDNLTAAPAAGDLYAIATNEYRLDTIIRQINKVLRDIMVETTDITTITTAADQTEYSLPTAMLDEGIEVWIQGKTNDTNDYKWQPYHDWYIQETATGTANKLVFHTQPPYPYLLKVVYWIPHDQLYTNSDQLHEGVDINRVALQAAVECMKWKKNQPGVHKKDFDGRIAELTARAERAKWSSPLGRVNVKLASWGENVLYLEIEDD